MSGLAPKAHEARSGKTYLIEANGRVDSLDGLSGRVEALGLRILVEESALDQAHALRGTLAEGVVEEAYAWSEMAAM